jgi:hypothetical protein
MAEAVTEHTRDVTMVDLASAVDPTGELSPPARGRACGRKAALVIRPVLIAPSQRTRSPGSCEDAATPSISAGRRPTDSQHTNGIKIMSQTSQGDTGD